METTILEIECTLCKRRKKANIDLDFNGEVTLEDIANRLGFAKSKNGGYICKKCRACNCC